MKQSILAVLVLVLSTAGCATAPKGPLCDLTITSEPATAIIYQAPEMEGPWGEYQKEAGLHVTPSTSRVPSDTFFWIKVKKKGYIEAEPQFARPSAGEALRLIFELKRAEKLAEIFVESEPEGATVLTAESMEGDYRPWPEAEGEAITPAHGFVPVGESFWLKVSKEGQKDSLPEYIHVEAELPVHISFDMAKRKRKVTSAAKSVLTVTSAPARGWVLASDAEDGRYVPWPPQEDLQITPMRAKIDVGSKFWLKVRRDGYVTSRPVVVEVEDQEPVSVHFDLEAAPKASVPAHAQPASALVAPAAPSAPPASDYAETKPQPGDAGVVAYGFAPVEGNEVEARNRAILDALGVAVQQKCGEQVKAGTLHKNRELLMDRAKALAAGDYASYDVIEDENENGVYRVKLRVLFKGDILKAVQGGNVSFLLGGRERVYADDERLESREARRAAADALMGESMRVTLEERDYGSAAEMAKRAEETRSDMALFLSARTELHDKWGEFYQFKTNIDYSLVIPVSADVIASGKVEGFSEERYLNARDAYNHSLRETGEKLAEAVLLKLAERYDRAGSYDVYIWGVPSQSMASTLRAELAGIGGVSEARLFAYDGKNCVFNLTISPDARDSIAGAVQRLRNVDLEVLESNPFNTVARIR